MNEGRLALAQEWFVKRDHDLANAEILYREHGFTDTIAFLIQQAVEKYLKGYLIAHGWALRKIHDLEQLLSEAMGIDQSFSSFLDAGRKITQYYIEARYPLDMPRDYSRDEIKKSLTEAQEIVAKIRTVLGVRSDEG